MSRHHLPPVLPMSQIIASDAPLLSPVSSESSWGQPHYSPTATSFDPNFPYSYAISDLPLVIDSPIPAHKMLKKSRYSSPDSVASSEQACVPTHQVFDFPLDAMSTNGLDTPDFSESPSPPSESFSVPASRAPSMDPASIRPSLTSSHSDLTGKRPSDVPVSEAKKQRASASRVSVKDFVPPDVSGMSKREARLVKNRAAAFLSRQRKREEFELMEVRVVELEQENLRLQAIASGSAPQNPSSSSEAPSLLSEIEQLKARLAESERREQELASRLSSSPVKPESQQTAIPSVKPEPRSPSLQHKSTPSASIGLVVLLCALPTLLGLPAHHHQSHSSFPTTYSYPYPSNGELLPFGDLGGVGGNMPGDYDYEYNWQSQGGSVSMDLDGTTPTRTLEFAPEGPLSGAGALDVSFDSVPSEDGKIRVRIHPSSSSSSAAGTGQTLTLDSSSFPSTSAAATYGYDSRLPIESGASQSAFLAQDADMGAVGADGYNAFGMGIGVDMDSSFGIGDGGYSLGMGLGSNMGMSASAPGKRKRVRITLMSGGEGGQGEWEVQVC